jgi:tRNA threonylcarbamoyladenosine biosynthesis protein TsaB
VVEAGRKRFGVGWYVSPNGRWVPDRKPELLSAEGLGAKITHRTLVSGELDAGAREILGRNPHVRLASPAGCVRRPAVLAELAWLRWQSGGWDDPAGLAPLYLSEAG